MLFCENIHLSHYLNELAKPYRSLLGGVEILLSTAKLVANPVVQIQHPPKQI